MVKLMHSDISKAKAKKRRAMTVMREILLMGRSTPKLQKLQLPFGEVVSAKNILSILAVATMNNNPENNLKKWSLNGQSIGGGGVIALIQNLPQ